ncbi:cobyrinate a,c-diamide synthase [Polycladidibacter stylochi]|uniref:cobyrinate a,c-diamide synthase n=1 Tax=Polycladidibacter stylochi TaxID=1807766 RepID=UPI00082C4ADC|nr:cobyrinate a,c-diamide synthase [Pseudovibrio stylochi]
MSVNGLVIAAPSSATGKTTITLALLRALKIAGISVSSAKSGPDYIDPAFHRAASGRPCFNLDAYAMSAAQLLGVAQTVSQDSELLIVEGAMGLFDGAANGQGSAADLAETLGFPVVLIVDCQKQAQSVAAVVHGFASFRKTPRIAGIILNRVGSLRHEKMLRQAIAPLGLPVLGAVYREVELELPERHLGLVQASEMPELESFLTRAGKIAQKQIDLAALRALARPLQAPIAAKLSENSKQLLAPLSQKIAIAKDVAFAFSYPQHIAEWKRQGVEITYFSPLNDEAPSQNATAIFLPGGYPELYAQRLSRALNFKAAMQSAAQQGTLIYGECGGFMCLGEQLIDKAGVTHPMLGLLPLTTSFEKRKLHLGYRQLQLTDRQKTAPVLPWQHTLVAHEFHYASIIEQGAAQPLFNAVDALGIPLEAMGLQKGRVAGSFAHIICQSKVDE